MIIFGTEVHTSLGSESAIAGKQGDMFGFGMLGLKAIVGKKKLNFTGGEGETMGLLRFGWSTHESGEKGYFQAFELKRLLS
jgi:hypothetical protein